MAYPEPDVPDVTNYITLVFQFDAGLGVTKLTVKGPKVPLVNESPALAFERKGNKYIFKIGGGDTTFAAGELSKELKAFLGGTDSSGRSGIVPLLMPSQSQLHRTDGTYKSFADYDRDVKMRQISAQKDEKTYSARWPKLPKPLYDYLIRYYSSQDMLADGNPLYL